MFRRGSDFVCKDHVFRVYSCGWAGGSGDSGDCAFGSMRAGSMAGTSGFGAGLELADGGRVSLPFEVSV